MPHLAALIFIIIVYVIDTSTAYIHPEYGAQPHDHESSALTTRPVFFNLGSEEPSGSAKCLNFFRYCICIIEITITIYQPTPFSLKSAYELNTVL